MLSNSSAPYQSFASILKRNLPASIQISIPDQGKEEAVQPTADLIVAVGTKAALNATTQTGLPVLAVMITKAGYEELLAQAASLKRPQEISAVYFDQPLALQIDFIRAVLPKHRRIGLLYSGNTHFNLGYLRQQVVDRDAVLDAKPVLSAEQLFPALEDLLENADVLLALPDNAIYNGINIRNIMLTTYRAGIPFIGLSQSYVTAGALGAVFSTPEQMSDQTAAAIVSFARSGMLPDPQYPRDYTISLNAEVARSLGIRLKSTEAIRQLMNSGNRAAP